MSSKRLMEMFKQLSDTGCLKMRDSSNVSRKLAKFTKFGVNSMQIISDFDRTMSKFVHNGVRNPTCYGIFEEDPELTQSVRDELRTLTEKYHKIEVDPALTEAQKTPYMVEWWEKGHKVMLAANLHRDLLEKTAINSKLTLRDGVHRFMAKMHQHEVPVLIFSAGLGNVIEPILKREKICYNNVHVISNFMDFDETGTLVGFQHPLIHVFNKTAASISDTDYYVDISSKKPCIMLLGDSTGDVHMSDGASLLESDHEKTSDPSSPTTTVLRIGFLNDEVDKNLDHYMSLYDIVLINDETFDVPMNIVDAVVSE